MAETKATILSGILDGMPAFLAARGIDINELLRRVDLAPELLAEPSNQIALDTVASLFEHAARESDDKLFGLHFAKVFRAGGTGIVGYLVVHAPDLNIAVDALSRYARLLISPIDMQFEEKDGVGCLNWTYPAGFKGPWAQYSLLTTCLVVLRIKRAAGRDWKPTQVEFEHRFDNDAELEDLLGAKLLFNRSRSAICFDADALSKPMPEADDTLYHVLKQHGDRLLKDNPDPEDIVARTRHAITNLLSDAAASDLEAVADKIDIPSRSLRLRLADLDTSFSKVLDETRRELADSYLRDTDMQMSEIAFALGFSELSVFTRASVSRWFGMSPSAYRQSIREPQGNGPET